MNNDTYVLLLNAMKTALGVLVFAIIANFYALYVTIKKYRKENKEAVVISYDKFNKGDEL